MATTRKVWVPLRSLGVTIRYVAGLVAIVLRRWSTALVQRRFLWRLTQVAR